ncbi:MAG: MerR family transcriptional regulator [Deltaproteobacteria bacterium]|nr:MerR family transcriptional regulator [Deltaproteobacteria bacterium]
MKNNIPDKLYFKIGEVAKLADLPTHVLRYWETEFSDIRPKRANSKQRLYRRKDVELILQIKTLLHEQGYTIAGARKALKEGGKILPEKQNKKQISARQYAKRMSLIKEQLQELQKILINSTGKR